MLQPFASRHVSKPSSAQPVLHENVRATRRQPPWIGDWKTFIRPTAC